MNRKHLRRGAAGLCAAFALALPAAASPIEHEVDTAGLLGAIGLAYGEHTLNAALSTTTEVDSYTFSALAGDQIRFGLHSFTVGLDLAIVLRGPTGDVLSSASCEGFGSLACSVVLDRTIATAGTYTLNVADNGLNETGLYQLHLDGHPPETNWAGVRYATAVNERLGHTTDVDFYAFNGVAGTGVTVAMGSLTVGLDAVFEVWDPLGARVSLASCEGFGSILCTAAANINLSLTGVYRVGLTDNGLDEVGNYQFQVSCLFGNCPLPSAEPPSPVPEPETWVLMLAGALTVGALARRRR